MNATSSTQKAIVVCALEFERAQLNRAGLERFADICCCGPGAANVCAWTQRLGPTNGAVILCGLAGALNQRMIPGTAHLADEVRDESGARWRPNARTSASRNECVIVSTARVATTSTAKAELARRSGADLVDLESVQFAQEAQRLAWNWMIVRGVSDGADHALPEGISDWVDERGRTRVPAVLGALVRKPAIVTSLWSLRRRSRAALAHAARLIESILSDESRARQNPTI